MLDREWRPHVFEPNANPDMSWNEYWQIIKAAKIATGEQKYPTLSKFVSILASFPFCNASVERVFSALKEDGSQNISKVIVSGFASSI